MKQVLITTSGLGQRLGELTKFTNKSLVRVGKKPALAYIIESYKDAEFIITIGHYGDLVKQFIKIAYPNLNVKFVEVDNYDQPGSSLGYSILKAKEFINGPFIFNSCDTIVFEDIPDPTFNWLGGFKSINNSHYTSYDVYNDNIINIKSKGATNSQYNYIGLAGIYNWKEFFEELEKIYNENKYDSSLSDCNAINAIINNKFKSIEFKTWLDIGNIESLNSARNIISDKFNILDKLDESIYLYEDKVIKFFANKEIANNRVTRGKSLYPLTPKIIDSTDNFYSYEFTEGETLSKVINTTKFSKLLLWAKHKLWKPIKSNKDIHKLCYDFYLLKTWKRADEYLKKYNLNDLSYKINGIEVPKLHDLLINPELIGLYKLVFTGQFHGDFILENIIETDEFKLIDWRQDFASSLDVGDIYYDLAKLNHNLIFDHDIINNKHYYISENECDILRRSKLADCQEVLFKFLEENELSVKKVKMLTALIWINMAALHENPLDHFLFNFGKYHLFRAIS